MNLTQVQALTDLYPPIRLRSGRKVETTQLSSKLEDGELRVVVKTVFPANALRRTELQVLEDGAGAIRVTPVEAVGLADAQNYAQRLRERCEQDKPQAPLTLVKEHGLLSFIVAPVEAAVADKGNK